MRTFPIFCAVLAAAMIAGCGIAPMPADYRNYAGMDQKAETENAVRIVIFNSSGGWKYGLDKSGHLNMKIDGKAVGHIPMKKYRIIEIEPGFHDVYLEHRDVWRMGSSERIEIKSDTKAIRIFAFEISNSLEVLDDLPFNFDATYGIVE